ncbi:MAG: murein transglycosylase, partial [Acidithiobacillus ferrivorans]
MHKNWASFPKTILVTVVTAVLPACATHVGTVNQAAAPAIATPAPLPLPALSIPEQPSTAVMPKTDNTCISNVAFPNFPRQYQERMQKIACHLQE